MKSSTFAGVAIASLLNTVAGKELPPNDRQADKYISGAVHMEIMGIKMAGWEAQIKSGQMEPSQYKSRKADEGPVVCTDGKAVVGSDSFNCNNIDFYDFKNHADLGSKAGQGSSSWGWTSDDGREFVVVAQADGAAFAEITSEGKLVYLGRLPQYSSESIWREIRGYKNYIVVGSEAREHGVQVFDWKKLLDIDPASPVTFTQDDLTSHFDGLPVGSTHNIVINEEKEYAIAVGAVPRNEGCNSGLIFIDLKDPSKPSSPGCAGGDGYVHDAQCIVYRGPDERYNEREICYGYNEDTLTIFDVTDKETTNIISRTSYEGATYTHQGWVTNTTWQEFLVLDDEYDEYDGVGPAADGYPVTYFWDIRDLENPKQTGLYKSKAYGIDHNQFVIDGISYQSNYGTGLRIIDVRSLPEDPTGGLVEELGFFDVYPENDDEPNGGSLEFVGTWSHYPFFKSGYILVNTIERGAFVVKRAD
ncbi:hypothetical protein N3K66_000855 [Trichothecium roseum]|uniref:Uncharacterized protein n=1 Tax=Trichothecium roseum TaxID=47278 RepID=A0ACC0VEM1_9HYPO|nr:hypothetical protein N3K66_000855 [Trichothecium roseum]